MTLIKQNTNSANTAFEGNSCLNVSGITSSEAAKTGTEALMGQSYVIWGVFAEALSYPDDELVEAVRTGTLAAHLSRLVKNCYPSVYEQTDWDLLKAVVGLDELAAEYTRLFDTAVNKSACSLYGGQHDGNRMTTMEEVLRFYNMFEASMAEQQNELPDHLTVELEFVHLLAYGDFTLTEQGKSAKSYALARRDFIDRHLGHWVANAREQLRKLFPLGYYEELFSLLEHCLQEELESLGAQCGPCSSGSIILRQG